MSKWIQRFGILALAGALFALPGCAAEGDTDESTVLSESPGDVTEASTEIGNGIPVECPMYSSAASLSSTASNAYFTDPMHDGTLCESNGVNCRPCNRADDINLSTGVADTQCRSRIVWQSFGWRCVRP
jgi:hypothetical protein